MNVAFRVDASIEIGSGHVMRCLTLADALRERGAHCIFICRDHVGNLNELIRRRGFEVLTLPVEASSNNGSSPTFVYEAWLGAGWHKDARQTIKVLTGIHIDLLVVDHYAIDMRWEAGLRSVCGQLMVIDDLANRQHECDLLLDQNLGRNQSDYTRLTSERCVILTGPKYSLLRPEFLSLREYSLNRRARKSQVGRILITMGGVDKDNVTGQVLEALNSCSLPEECHVTVVMGAKSPWLTEVQRTATQMKKPTEVLVSVENMAELMAESDLAIGAGGGTSWERCCLGLPALLAILSENQRPGGQALEKAGASLLLDDLHSIDDDLNVKLGRMMSSDFMHAMHQACAGLVDGKGVNRVTDILDRAMGEAQ